MRRLVWILSLLAVLSAACGDDTTTSPRFPYHAEEEITIGVTFAGKSTILVQGINGTIDMTSVPGASSVIVTAVKRVESDTQADADARLDEIVVHVDSVGGGLLSVYTQHLVDDTGGRGYTVDYTVTVPGGMRVGANNVNGDVWIRSIRERVSILLVNGKARADDIEGPALINVVNGSIFADITLEGTETAELGVTNGGIELHIPRPTSAWLYADAPNGVVAVTGLYVDYSERTLTHVIGKVGDGDGRIDLDVTNGPIKVKGY